MNFAKIFTLDKHKYNKIPNNFALKFFFIFFNQRYSMPVLLRLTEYFYRLSVSSTHLSCIYKVLAIFPKRLNEVLNQFEHGYSHHIAPGVLFHHTGVTLAEGTTIQANVQIFKNVTLALSKKRTCDIGKNTVIFSHVLVLGASIGENCVIGGGSVVISDIPSNSVVVGNPGRIIKKCNSTLDYLEFT